jgi:hypothetical protein
MLVGVELPLNPKDRVTFTLRAQGRFILWFPEIRVDGLGVASAAVGVGLQLRMR